MSSVLPIGLICFAFGQVIRARSDTEVECVEDWVGVACKIRLLCYVYSENEISETLGFKIACRTAKFCPSKSF